MYAQRRVRGSKITRRMKGQNLNYHGKGEGQKTSREPAQEAAATAWTGNYLYYFPRVTEGDKGKPSRPGGVETQGTWGTRPESKKTVAKVAIPFRRRGLTRTLR